MKRIERCSEEVSDGLSLVLASMSGAGTSRVKSGIPELDELTGGFLQGGLTVMLGDCNSGKSILARNIALTASLESRTLVAPLQDGRLGFCRKIAAMKAGVSPLEFGPNASATARLAEMDAKDRIVAEHELCAYAIDGLTVLNLLHARASRWFCNGDRDVDPLEGKGLILVDSMTLLVVRDAREATSELRSLVYDSEIAAVATCAGDRQMLNELADASTVLLIERGEEDGKVGSILITALKDDESPIAGAKTSVRYDLETLKILRAE